MCASRHLYGQSTDANCARGRLTDTSCAQTAFYTGFGVNSFKHRLLPNGECELEMYDGWSGTNVERGKGQVSFVKIQNRIPASSV